MRKNSLRTRRVNLNEKTSFLFQFNSNKREENSSFFFSIRVFQRFYRLKLFDIDEHRYTSTWFHFVLLVKRKWRFFRQNWVTKTNSKCWVWVKRNESFDKIFSFEENHQKWFEFNIWNLSIWLNFVQKSEKFRYERKVFDTKFNMTVGFVSNSKTIRFFDKITTRSNRLCSFRFEITSNASKRIKQSFWFTFFFSKIFFYSSF